MFRLAKFGIILTAAALLCWPASLLAGQKVPSGSGVGNRP
jgi:hypothetical protein